ncbi:MAG TPA: VanW family protein [Fimbriimonadaceae bacterium]|nr:VanW family protein [Fimbriimonadaceae bacterium]
MRRWAPLVTILVVCAAIVSSFAGRGGSQRTLSRYVTPLGERMENQRHNAILCLKELDGTVIAPGAEFSFNKAVGSWSRDKGYRRAPVSFGGMLVDSWGGGVCQTSSTLYNTALLAGMEIEERHRHHYAPTYIAPGRDAAVAFPNIDLRFRNPYDFPVTIVGKVTPTGIQIDLVGDGGPVKPVEIVQRVAGITQPADLVIGSGRFGRVRNPGHAGYSVQTYRIMDGQKELLSNDDYPVMNRIVEYKNP